MILILDDDPAVREALTFLLELDGFVVKAFGDPHRLAEALPIADARCLLTNHQMPGLTGLQVIKIVRKRGLTIPIILMSGDVSPALKAKALGSGANAVVEKPFLDNALVDTIRSVCVCDGCG